ncbi:TRAP transporter large permease subunit [Fundicoccus sp. Sow4_H7]|uniref:TRAP transporter large permease subunit n=1 Tax=Fundicoccus sp. Sow4_H7 TaxID=3438784 RepID=UPI003F934A87
MFMDVAPAILIFTKIFLPIVTQIGVDPVHNGLSSIMNLWRRLHHATSRYRPLRRASVAKVTVEKMLKPMIPFYLVIIAILFLITYLPQLVMWLPKLAN